jgi:hypothetical protein
MDGSLLAALLDPPRPTAIAPGAGARGDDDDDLKRFTQGTPLHGDLPRVSSDSWGVREGWRWMPSIRSLVANHGPVGLGGSLALGWWSRARGLADQD